MAEGPRLWTPGMLHGAGMQRPNLIAEGRGHLSLVEKLQVGFVKRTFQPGPVANSMRWMQEHVGRRWIQLATKNLHHMHHTERLPKLARNDSFILVANHRSFFDMYIITAGLLGLGIQQRMIFPVRSKFFYDNPSGLVVNGLMSFFAMYPPIFRDRKRAFLNTVAMDELVWLLKDGGHFVGFHPEGTRNKGDPYELLPVRPGIGKLIRQAQVMVIPAFTNGLLPDDLKRQISSNFDGTGTPIHTVFGEPIDFGDLLQEPPTHALHRQISNEIHSVLTRLGQEERVIRKAFGSESMRA